jgi:hypothetical protein
MGRVTDKNMKFKDGYREKVQCVTKEGGHLLGCRTM